MQFFVQKNNNVLKNIFCPYKKYVAKERYKSFLL